MFEEKFSIDGQTYGEWELMLLGKKYTVVETVLDFGSNPQTITWFLKEKSSNPLKEFLERGIADGTLNPRMKITMIKALRDKDENRHGLRWYKEFVEWVLGQGSEPNADEW